MQGFYYINIALWATYTLDIFGKMFAQCFMNNGLYPLTSGLFFHLEYDTVQVCNSYKYREPRGEWFSWYVFVVYMHKYKLRTCMNSFSGTACMNGVTWCPPPPILPLYSRSRNLVINDPMPVRPRPLCPRTKLLGTCTICPKDGRFLE
jgi:hypothetical protein